MTIVCSSRFSPLFSFFFLFFRKKGSSVAKGKEIGDLFPSSVSSFITFSPAWVRPSRFSKTHRSFFAEEIIWSAPGLSLTFAVSPMRETREMGLITNSRKSLECDIYFARKMNALFEMNLSQNGRINYPSFPRGENANGRNMRVIVRNSPGRFYRCRCYVGARLETAEREMRLRKTDPGLPSFRFLGEKTGGEPESGGGGLAPNRDDLLNRAKAGWRDHFIAIERTILHRR